MTNSADCSESGEEHVSENVCNITPVTGEVERKPLPPVRVAQPITIVVFGASGDLARRKLMPAIFAAFSRGLLRERIAIVGIARGEHSTESFRQAMREALSSGGRAADSGSMLDRFIGRIFYHRGDVDDPESYRSLQERLEDREQFPPNRLFYLAVAPRHFSGIVLRLREAGLVYAPHSQPWSRVVIEKPFGSDLASARRLNLEVLSHLNENQVYRIDHYLGKETVQNILGFRFANSIFEPLFNNHHVDHIQITAAETVGMESGRGPSYDSAGALRDMVQNHLLQLLCLVGMEPPSDMTADAIHHEKVRLLRAVVPPRLDAVPGRIVRAQYSAGTVAGRQARGYLDEDRIPAGSQTETYCALQLSIDNWRWAGVPVYMRTGKRLARRATEIAIQFKMPPLQLFRTVECEGDVCDLTLSHPNVLVFRIQPDEGIALQFSAKRPAMQFVVESVAMDFSYQRTWRMSLSEAYERLLIDAMRGDSTLFTRSDEVDAAWQIVDPVLRAWQSGGGGDIDSYPAGSWGPAAADRLMAQSRRTWRQPGGRVDP